MVLSLIKGLKPPLLLVFSFSKHSALHARFWRGCIVCGKNSKFYWLVVRPCPAFFSRIFMSLCFVAVRIKLGDCRNLTRVCIPQKVAVFSNHPVTPSKNAHFIAEFPPKVWLKPPVTFSHARSRNLRPFPTGRSTLGLICDWFCPILSFSIRLQKVIFEV